MIDYNFFGRKAMQFIEFDISVLYQKILPPHGTAISSFDSCREMVKERRIRTVIPIQYRHYVLFCLNNDIDVMLFTNELL